MARGLCVDKRESPHTKHVIISCVLFGIFYWIAAYHKPFHVDEFYSWVYAQRCSFKDILLLKDSGIGHPPLYHLLQKTVQETLPSYHFLYVRFINFIFGWVFVFCLNRFLIKHSIDPFLCYGIAASAVVLDTFVFSRMWGLVCLVAVLVLIFGEKYAESRKRRYLYLLFPLALLGLLADYNFILLAPYFLSVLLAHRCDSRHAIIVTSGLLFIWVFLRFLMVGFYQGDFTRFAFLTFQDFVVVQHTLVNMVLYFGFEELLVGALLLVGLSWLVYRHRHQNVKRSNGSWLYVKITMWFAAMMSIHLLLRWDMVRVRTMFPVVGLLVIVAIREIVKAKIGESDLLNKRLLLSIAGSLCLLLVLNTVVYRGLLEVRFVLILSPLMFFLMGRNLSQRMVRSLSIVLMLSGALYLPSAGVSDIYPVPDVKTSIPVIFEDEFSYSDSYLRSNTDDSVIPFILVSSNFEKYCRVCRMGTDQIPYDSMDRLLVVTRHEVDPSRLIPPEFSLVSKVDALNWLDRIQFKYLTPMNRIHFVLSEYKRSG